MRVNAIRVLVLCLSLVLVAAACGSDDGEGSIWVLLPDSSSSARWEADDRKFLGEAFEAAGVKYNIVNAEGDPIRQREQAEQAIVDGARVIILVNLDPASGAAIVKIAHDGGATIIDYDRLTLGGDGADVYVSFDIGAVGATMAEFVEPAIEALGVSPAKLALLNGEPSDNNSKVLKAGYTRNLDTNVASGAWEVVADEDTPDWDNYEALLIYEQILVSNNNEVDATFAANDGLANSVIAARKSAGLGPIPLSGQDATVAGLQNVLSGWQTMSVYKAIKAEASAAAAVAVALFNGETVDSVSGDWSLIDIDNGTNMVPYVALVPVGVTKDNIAETVIADGFRNWAEICVGDFEEFCPDGWDS